MGGVGGFGIKENFPVGELPAQFAGIEREGGIVSGLPEVDGAGENAAGAETLANGGKQVALQIEKVADEVVRVGLDGKFAALEIGHARIDGQAGGALAQPVDSRRGAIHGGDAPAQRRQIEGIAPVAAGQIQRAAGRHEIGYFHEERCGREIKTGGVAIVLVPVPGQGTGSPVTTVQLERSAGGCASAASHSCSSAATDFP